MDDTDVLDWENEDDEQQQQNGDSGHQSIADNDADDAVSLGDDDEQLEEPQTGSNTAVKSLDFNFGEQIPDGETKPALKSSDSYHKADRSHENEARPNPHKESPHRSQPTAGASTRLPHALPPKPVLAAALAPPPSTRGPSMRGHVVRSSLDTKSANGMSPTSPSLHSAMKIDIVFEWEARLSSRGDTYYYNRTTFESTWEKPATYIAAPTSSDDGRQGRHNVSTTSFRSSPTQSDMASQDLPLSRTERDDTRKPSRGEPVSLQDRYYRPTETGYSERGPPEGRRADRNEDRYSHGDHERELPALPSAPAMPSRSRARARSISPAMDGQNSYSRAREREPFSSHIPDPTYRSRNGPTDTDSLQQKGRAYDDSRQPSRYTNPISYSLAEDRIHSRPSLGRRQSSPPRISQTESRELQPVATPRRRPSPPPSALLPHDNSVPRSHDQRPTEPRSWSSSKPIAEEYPREPRMHRPSDTQGKIPTGPALSERPSSSRVKPYDDRDYGERRPGERRPAESGHGFGQPVDEPRDRDHLRDRPRRDDLEGASIQDTRDLHIERSRYLDETPLNSSRIPERPRADRRAKRTKQELEQYREEMERKVAESLAREARVRETVTAEERDSVFIDPNSYRGPPAPHVLAITARREKRLAEYPPPPPPPPLSRYLDAPEKVSASDQRLPDANDHRAHRGGPSSRQQVINEPAGAHDSRLARSSHPQEDLPPVRPPRDSYRESDGARMEVDERPDSRHDERVRAGRRDSSPRKSGKREAARKLVSGPNSTPLGKTRYTAGDSAPSLPPPPPLLQRTGPRSASPDHHLSGFPPPNWDVYPSGSKDRSADPVPSRRDIYERPPETVRYPEHHREARYDSIPRGPIRANPPPDDFGRRVSDPHSIPPHMQGRELRGDHFSGSGRRARHRSPTPERRLEPRAPTEPRRLSNANGVSLPDRHRIPTSPNLTRDRSSSTLAGSGASFTSELGRRVSDPSSMVVDGATDRFTPPSDRFDTLRLASGSQPRDVGHALSSSSVPPVTHPLPPKPSLAARESQSAETSAHGSDYTSTRDDRSERRSRWGSPVRTTRASSSVEAIEMATEAPTTPAPLPVSPTTSKKAITEITPPRLRRPTASVNASDLQTSSASGSGREDQRPREKDEENDRTVEGAGLDAGASNSSSSDRVNGRPEAPAKSLSIADRLAHQAPPMARSNSLLDRLGPEANYDRDQRGGGGRRFGDPAPSLRDRVSIPSKRDLEDLASADRLEDSFDMPDDGVDVANKRRRKNGGGHGRARRPNNSRRH